MSSLPKTKTLVQLAEDILKGAKELEKHLPSSPTFRNDTISTLPPEYQYIRKSLIDDSSDMAALVRGAGGPLGRIFDMSYSFLDHLAFQAICHFHIPQAVPLNGEISFSELAEKLNKITEAQLTRLVRHAMNIHLFQEPTKGLVAHTADTMLLVQDSTLFDLALTLTEVLRPASLKVTEAIERWPGSDEPTHTGWQLAYGTDKLMYETIKGNEEVQKRFSAHLEQIAKQDPRTGEKVAAMFTWSRFPQATVVDVGGGNGQYSVALAQAYPGMRFIVQDVPGVLDARQEALPAELKDKVRFMAHDMFKPQPVEGADIYFLRHILHNWSDAHCVRILKALVPGLKPGARVLTCDLVIPEKGTAPAVEATEIRRLDMLMFSLYNAREREVEEFAGLFERADKRFDFIGAHGLEGCHDKICEAIWRG
ncbi:6-hydroxytryprostatin B O-methyltransferase [Cytospora mali]|uniref:6-hydroxytryprostatin B O-methyltransferase n=1 Tax=Cytospora mali TaxID=578113 RepID=A0A194W972_CYTMA|nr:6-hydroxytryprostatin B O-methyltransferase [Valsa mali]